MRTIIKALVKIIALVFVLKLLGSLINNISYAVLAYTQFQFEESLFVYLATAICLIIIIGLIIYFGWWKADRIARLLAGDMDENAIAVSTTNVDLYRVIISAFGIYLLITSIPGLAGLISYHLYYNHLYADIDLVRSTDVAALASKELEGWVTQALTFLLGIWLTFGSRPIARFLVRISSADSG